MRHFYLAGDATSELGLDTGLGPGRSRGDAPIISHQGACCIVPSSFRPSNQVTQQVSIAFGHVRAVVDAGAGAEAAH